MINNQEKNSKIEESTIADHEQFNNFLSESLRVGSHLVGAKGSGKTRLGFVCASELMKLDNVRVIIWDGSDTWKYAFNQIPFFNVSEKDILANSRTKTDDIEKYELVNWNLVKLALDTQKHLLFSLNTRSPSRRGFFIRTCINYLDAIQRKEKETSPNHENKQALAYFIEESQNAFNSKSSQSLECETFQTVFSEARNNREGFFTNSQRLTDCSKTVRTKQYYAIGKLNIEDISPQLKRIEKQFNIDFNKMKDRHWFYEGKTFESPTFTQQGKPFRINQTIKEAWLNSLPKTKVLTLKDKIKLWFNPQVVPKVEKETPNSLFESKKLMNIESEESKDWSEDSEFNEDREDEEDELLFGDIL